MSLSSAMNAALSGLTVSARMAELVSSNVANAMTPGYVRRTAELAARELGGQGQGVRLAAVLRNTDTHLLTERRTAEAAEAGTEALASFLSRVEQAIGTAGSATSLSARVDTLDAALLAAASRPESDVRLGAAVEAATALAAHLGAASATIQAARSDADTRIAAQVERLNDGLAQIADLNTRIQISVIAGQDTSALFDLRQQQIDAVAELVPIREVARADGAIALFTPGGASLVEGKGSVFAFTSHPVITAGMTQDGGALSGLILNGRVITTGADSLIGGGSLSAQFAIRDDLAPAAQTRLDGLARDLIQRFSGLDDTLPTDAPGLFTDGQTAFSGDETGLTARLAVNEALDGATWRLRDGLGATTPGPAGDASRIIALQGAMTTALPTDSAALPGGSRSLALRVSDLGSASAAERLSADTAQSFASARATALNEQELAGGVDTDQEMQSLLAIENAWSANARVLQLLDDLLARLMEI